MLKDRLRLHRISDKMRHQAQNDSVIAQFNVIRLLLNLSKNFSFCSGCLDFKSAFMHSGFRYKSNLCQTMD